MVRILKRTVDDGFVYEIDNFSEYVEQLRQRGIEISDARYRVFISFENENLIHDSLGEWEEQVALFFRLGASVGIPFQIAAA